MPGRQLLSKPQLADALRQLEGWNILGGKLHREYRFTTFVEAFAFMTRVALLAQRLNHHPSWSNIYNTVTINLTTHDAGGITGMDTALAGMIDKA